MTRHRSLALGWLMVVLVAVSPARAQEFGGIKIGDAFSKTFILGPVTAQERQGRYVISTWRRPDGHDLSITNILGGPVVYMESFRNQRLRAVTGPGLRFGVTRLGDMRQLLGNDGFTYDARARVSAPGGAQVYFKSYEIANQRHLVMTFAFVLPRAQFAQGAEVAALDSLIVAESWYLAQIWGEGRTATPGYAPISITY